MLSRLLTSLLYEIQPHDGATLAAIALLVGLVSTLACLVPGIRATRVDPAAARDRIFPLASAAFDHDDVPRAKDLLGKVLAIDPNHLTPCGVRQY